MLIPPLPGDADVDEITSVANEVKLVLGTNRTPVGAEAMTQPAMSAENFPIITKRTAVAALATVLIRFDAVLGSLDWLLARLKLIPPPGELLSENLIIYDIGLGPLRLLCELLPV